MTKSYMLHIENFLTIDEMNINLDKGVVGFVGKNAVGKTNVLTAIQTILSGKRDSKLIKDGETRAEIRLEELEHGKIQNSVSRVLQTGVSRLESKGLEGTTPKKWLSSLLDEIAINPLRIISEDPVKYLKQHLKIKVKESELLKPSYIEFSFDVNGNSFLECDKVSEKIADARVKQYQKYRHHKELEEELSNEVQPMPPIPKLTSSQLENEVVNLKAEQLRYDETLSFKQEIEQEINVVYDEAMSLKENIKKYKEDLGQLSTNLFEKEQETKRKIEELKNIYRENELEAKALELQLKEKINSAECQIQTCRDKKARLDEQESQIKIFSPEELTQKFTSFEMSKMEIEKYNYIKSGNDKYQRAIQRTLEEKETYDAMDDDYKYYAYKLPSKLIDRANLPVEGIEFKDKELFVNNRHIDRLSTAERHLVAVKLAVALAEEKGHIAVCLDGIEVFDVEHRKEFLKAVENAGLKVLYTRHGEKEYEHEIQL